ncbi:MAG: S-layer homology domain-containing protein, partial [Lachnospiraceae bacterium]|nr:S-layer homology domain-containing protein [Lachnospiraceae bacterium]
MDRIIVVSAVSESGSADHGSTLCPWSDGGSGDLCEIAAPGADVFSTVCKNTKPAYLDGGYALLSGTSMAAPMVTAVCALTWSVNPSLTGSEVRQLVEDNCSDGTAATNTSTWTDKNNNIRSSHTTGGMHILNAKRAVEAAVDTRPEIYGYIADKKTDAPVPAQIEIHKGTAADGEQVGDLISDTEIYQFVADASGKVTLPRLPSGKYTLVVSAEGYYNSEKTITVVDGGVLIDAATVAEDFGKILLTSVPVVKFETNGGSPVSSQVVDYGYTAAKPAAPVKTGYDFGGWYTDKNCTDPFDFSTPITEDITLYAKWIPKEFTVTWVIDGKEEKETCEYGTTPSHAVPTKEGDAKYSYIFKEWTPAIVEVTGDATYTAVFDSTVNHYSVTWVIEGWAQTEDYAYGDMPWHSEPSKSGALGMYYVFKGWNPTVVPVTGNAVYTAVFNAQINPLFPGIQKPSGVNTSVPDKEPTLPSFVSDPEPAVLPFTDVTPDSPYLEDIQYVYENDLMIGMSDTEFGENLPLTRGMIVTVLHRMEGKPDVTYSGVFTDVPAGEWYTDGVEWAASHGIVLGYGNGKFGPKDNVTREQLAAILFRYANWKGYDTSVGEDTNILSYDDAFTWGDWAVSALQWACGAGVLEDVPVGMLRPTEPATRGEIAHAIRVFCE